jgi:hypothetical protein
MIKQQFKYLHVEFSGSIRELIEKIEKLKNEHNIEFTAEKHISDLLKKDIEIYKKDLINEKLKNELLEIKLAGNKKIKNYN